MTELFKYKNWEVFLILFLIPFFIYLALPFVSSTLIPSSVFVLVWIGALSLWFFQISRTFKTSYLHEWEMKVYNFNLIAFNSMMFILVPFILLMFYTDMPWVRELMEPISKINWILKGYTYLAVISNFIITSRIIAAYKLQRKISPSDHYESSIAFIFLPVGIFWIQNEIRGMMPADSITENKNRGYALIGFTVFLMAGTAFVLKDAEITFNAEDPKIEDFVLDSSVLQKSQRQSDSIFNSLDNKGKADYIMKLAISSYKQGDFKNTINCLNACVHLDSLNPMHYYNRGVVLANQFGQLDSGILNMTSAIKLDSNFCNAYLTRGHYYYLLNKYELSLPDIDKAVVCNPDSSEVFFLRGEIKEQLHDIHGACIDWHMASSLGDSDAIVKIESKCK